MISSLGLWDKACTFYEWASCEQHNGLPHPAPPAFRPHFPSSCQEAESQGSRARQHTSCQLSFGGLSELQISFFPEYLSFCCTTATVSGTGQGLGLQRREAISCNWQRCSPRRLLLPLRSTPGCTRLPRHCFARATATIRMVEPVEARAAKLEC